MGIRGLGKYLRARAPRAIHSFKPIAGLWAVDISCILFRARGAGLSLPSVIASLIVRLRRAGAEPVFVFDGSAPAAKADVIEQRRAARAVVQKEMANVRTELEAAANRPEGERADLEVRLADLQKTAPSVAGADRDAVKQLLHAAGAMFLTATREADDLLGFLARSGIVVGAISSDMDMLARGVPRLVMPETPDCSVLTEVSLSDVLRALNVTYDQFVTACQLMGSDYTPAGWRTAPPAEALAAVRAADFMLDPALIEGFQLLRGEGATLETLLSAKQLARWLAGWGESEPAALAEAAAAHGWPRDWLTVLGASVGGFQRV